MVFFLWKRRLLLMIILLYCLMMVMYPELTAMSVQEAVALWMKEIVPSILPFLMVAGLLQKSNLLQKLPVQIYPFILAACSGYPMGAKAAGDAYRDRCVDEAGLYHLLQYCMVTGPAFIIGTVGSGFLQGKRWGYILAISHYSAALIQGWRFCRQGKEGTLVAHGRNRESAGFFSDLTESIYDSFKALGVILAYIMLFSIGMNILSASGFFGLCKNPVVEALGKGLLEMTIGCHTMCQCNCTLLKKVVACSFILSFGGLSVLGQSLSMLKDCPVSFWTLLAIKVKHGVISAIITFILCRFMI